MVRPGPTRNRLISRLPNEVTKPNRAPATMPGRIAGRVMRQKVIQALAPRFCAASSVVRSTPARLAVTSRTIQGMTITTWPATRRVEVPSTSTSSAVLGLDMEDVHRGAQHDARHDQRHQQQVGERRAQAEAEARHAERGRHAQRQADQGREHADLEAEREAVDELALVEDGREPAQAVALGREGRDLLPEEGEPDHEDQRRQDVEQRDRRRAVQRPAAARRGRWRGIEARGAQRVAISSVFLWKLAALHDGRQVGAAVLEQAEILQRIAVDHQQVGEGAGLRWCRACLPGARPRRRSGSPSG